MAKQPKKSKKPKKKTPDLLAKTLEVLTTLDRETAKAIRLLCIANQVPIDKVVLKRKEFEVDGKSYHAKLSQFQWDQILAVAGGGNLAALVKVREILSGLAVLVSGSEIALFVEMSGDPKSKGKKPSRGAIDKQQIGCCSFADGPSEPLTQAQCTMVGGTGWNPNDPDCSQIQP
jgi:hypothetical protein